MAHLRVIALFASVVALAAGCAAQGTAAVASLAESDASRSAIPPGLAGVWRGSFVQAGGDGHVEGEMTLQIKDDATYKLVSTRRGRGDVGGRANNDSGVVVANDRRVTLQSSSGQWVPLTRKGDTLYGLTKFSTGHTVQIRLERTSAVESP